MHETYHRAHDKAWDIQHYDDGVVTPPKPLTQVEREWGRALLEHVTSPVTLMAFQSEGMKSGVVKMHERIEEEMFEEEE